MRNSRTVLMLFLATALVGLALLFSSQWMRGGQKTAAVPATMQLVAAAADLPVGAVLTEPVLKTIEWQGTTVPAGSFQSASALIGRVLLRDIGSGELLTDKALAPVGTLGGLSAGLKDGMRAITVQVDKVSGVAGFALPGNYVDVLLTGRVPRFKLNGVKGQVQQKDQAWQNEHLGFTKVILEKVLVLAVAQQSTSSDRTPKLTDTVTLQVSAEQAVKLELASSLGRVSLLLRNQSDEQPIKQPGQSDPSVLQLSASAPLAKAGGNAAKNCTRAIIGTTAVNECF